MPESAELPILLRAHTVLPNGRKRRKIRRGRRTWRRSDYSLVLSCVDDMDEVVPGIIGAFRLVHLGEVLDAGLICDDSASEAQIATVKTSLEAPQFVKTRRGEGTRIVSREGFVRKVLVPAALELKAVVVGFNLPAQLSRLSVKWSIARKEPFRGGFSFTFRQYVDKSRKERGDSYTPRIAVKAIDGKRSLIGFTSSWRKQPQKGKRHRRGSWVDLRTLAYTLTGNDLSLEEACGRFGVNAAASGGPADLQEPLPALQGRAETIERLYDRIINVYERIGAPLPPEEAYSAASIGKAVLRKMGVRVPHLRVDPGLRLTPDQVNGWAMASYFGGRAECRARRVPLPVAYCDFRSMYPTVFVLMGLWALLTAESIVVEDATEEVRQLLGAVTPEDLYDPAFWKGLAALVKVQPEGDVLPVRARFGRAANIAPSIAVSNVTSPFPLIYTLADCVSSKLLTGKSPHVLRAIRFRAIGRQSMRRASLSGLPPIDPGKEDFFQWLVEARYRRLQTTPPPFSDLQRDFLKVLVNSTSYGIFIELIRQEGFPTDVDVYGVDSFTSSVENPEQAGDFYMPVLGTLVTGGARLMLAFAEYEVTRLGGTYCFMDTDSIAIVSTPEGGLVPCPGGPGKMSDRREAVLALSRSQVEEIIDKFKSLNPYKQDLVLGSILELEEENFQDEGRDPGEHPQLWCYAVIAKRYVLFNLEDGELRIRKASEHTLGSYLPPIDPGTGQPIEDWIRKSWQIVLRQEMGIRREVMPTWHAQLALRALRISRPHMMEWFEASGERARPYGLFQHALPAPFYSPPTSGDGKPVCLIQPVSGRSTSAERWIDLHDPEGPTYRVVTGRSRTEDKTTFLGETYGDLIEQHPLRPEPKSVDSAGHPCSRHTKGLLARRNITVAGVNYIGKEANELELIEAGLVTDEEEFLTEYQRDIRDLLPEILRLIPAELVQKELNISMRYAFALRRGERRPSKRRLSRVVRVSAQFARKYLADKGEVAIPADDELAIWRMTALLRR